MFKSRLQEYCHSKGWKLPEYESHKEGPDHCPSFKAVVEVNGFSFISPELGRTAKEAQNLAAKVAFEHFSGGTGSSYDHLTTLASSDIIHPERQKASQLVSGSGNVKSTRDSKRLHNEIHIYKNQLQIYAQKRSISLPQYSIIREGAHHLSRFRAVVTIEGKTYDSFEFYNTVKEAESAAAEAAIKSLFPDGLQEGDLYMYKNLLQELVMKEYSCLPIYTSHMMGASHMAMFASTVEIKGEIFEGLEAKTKKQAEMNAAKVAYSALIKRRCKQKQITDHIAMDLVVKETTEPKPPSNTLKDCIADTSMNLVVEARPSFSEQCELNKEAKGQASATTRPDDVRKNGDSLPHSSTGARGTKRAAGATTVTSNNGLTINLDAETGPDGSLERKIVVFPNGPNVKIPPGVRVLVSDENHIAVTKV